MCNHPERSGWFLSIPMKLLIKNMVCGRCITAVDELLKDFGAEVHHIGLGLVELEEAISEEDKQALAGKLEGLGFELLSDEISRRVEHVKAMLIDEIHHRKQKKPEHQTYSAFLSKEMGYDYSYLNDLFASLESKTIGQFITLQKIEKAKELLIYNQLNLAEIADQLEYSSAQYLSSQFKKVTGMTPSQFKSVGKRKSIDSI